MQSNEIVVPSAAVLPVGQMRHTVALVPPNVPEYLPTEHRRQLVVAKATEYVPLPQSRHSADELKLNFPGAQPTHVCTAAADSDI